MKLQKPKILYRYNNMKVEKHKLTIGCWPQYHMETEFGILFRCHTCHDYYGYATLKEAKKEEIARVKKEIHERQEWLKKNEDLNA